jgi:hypothetical protein
MPTDSLRPSNRESTRVDARSTPFARTSMRWRRVPHMTWLAPLARSASIPNARTTRILSIEHHQARIRQRGASALASLRSLEEVARPANAHDDHHQTASFPPFPCLPMNFTVKMWQDCRLRSYWRILLGQPAQVNAGIGSGVFTVKTSEGKVPDRCVRTGWTGESAATAVSAPGEGRRCDGREECPGPEPGSCAHQEPGAVLGNGRRPLAPSAQGLAVCTCACRLRLSPGVRGAGHGLH